MPRYLNPLTDRIMAVLADGAEMTAFQIADALKISRARAANAMAHLQTTRRAEICGEVSRGPLAKTWIWRKRETKVASACP